MAKSKDIARSFRCASFVAAGSVRTFDGRYSNSGSTVSCITLAFKNQEKTGLAVQSWKSLRQSERHHAQAAAEAQQTLHSDGQAAYVERQGDKR
jgi:hypothetical protein